MPKAMIYFTKYNFKIFSLSGDGFLLTAPSYAPPVSLPAPPVQLYAPSVGLNAASVQLNAPRVGLNAPRVQASLKYNQLIINILTI